MVVADEWEDLNSQVIEAYQSKQYFKAMTLAEQSLGVARNVFGQVSPKTLTSMNNLAAVYNAQGEHKKVTALFVEIVALNQEMLGDKHLTTLVSEKNLAAMYQSQGVYDKAERLYKKVFDVRKELLGERHPDLLASMNDLAFLYHLQGRYSKAETLYVRALSLRKQVLGDKHPDTLTSVNNLAALFKALGRYEKAEPLFVENLAVSQEILGEGHPLTLSGMGNLAALYKLQGRHKKAEQIYVDVLVLSKDKLGSEHQTTLTNMNNLALLYESQALYEKAEPLYVETLRLRKKVLGEQHPLTLGSMNNLAALYKSKGHYEKAEIIYINTLALRKKVLGREHPDTLISMNNLAAMYTSRKQYRKAEPLYRDAFELSEEMLGRQHPDTLTSMINLATLYQASRRWERAHILWDQYLARSNQFLNQVLWGAGEKTRMAYVRQHEFYRNNILSLYSYLITESENNSWYSFSGIDPVHIAEQAWRVSISRKGLLLRIASEVSALSKINQGNDPQLLRIINQIKQARGRIAALTFSSKPDLKKLTREEEELNTLQRQLGAKVSGFRDKTKDVEPKQILAALSGQQAIVDFLVLQEMDVETLDKRTVQVIALVIMPETGVKLIRLGALASVVELIQSYRGAIEPRYDDNTWFGGEQRKRLLDQVSLDLYQTLWKPLAPFLRDKEHVFLVPDGILHLLPFKALKDEGGQYLGSKVLLTRLGSARDIVVLPVERKTAASVIIANPVYAARTTKISSGKGKIKTVSDTLGGIEFSPLPGTKTESESIQRTMREMKQDVNLYTQLEATEVMIGNVYSPRVLHIATHGFFLENIKTSSAVAGDGRIQLSESGKAGVANVENPLARSGLALTYANQGISGKKQADGSDGVLTAMEVLNLHLEGTELVTLSACETGVGEVSVGEGVYSLNRAFQEAGAKAVMSTLWSISDAGTDQFMRKFYQRFFNNKSAQQALTDTQDELKNTKQWGDPFFWAPFIMTGF